MRIGRKSLVLVLLVLGLTVAAAGQLECVTGDCDREGDPSDPTDNGFYTDQTPHSMISDDENMNFDYLNDPEDYPQDNKRQWPKACGDDPNEYLVREHAATYGGESNPDLSGRADYYACADRPTDCVFDGEVYSHGQLVDIQGEGGQESGYVDSVDQEICVDIDPEIPGGEWVDPDNESVRSFLIGGGTPQNPEYYVRYGEPARTAPGKVMWHNGSASGTHNNAAHEAMVSPFNPADFQTGYALEDDCDPRLRDDQYSGCDDTGIWEELIRGQFVYSPFKAGMYADDPNAFGEVSVRMWVGDGTGEDGSASHGSNNGQDQENVPGFVDFTVNAGGETVELNDSEIDPLEDTWAIAENPYHAVGPTGGIWPNGSCYGTPVLEPYDMQVNKGERVVGNSFAKALDVVGDDRKEGVWVDPDTTNETTLTGGTSCDLNGTDWGIGYNTGSGKNVEDNNAEPQYEPTDLHVVTGNVTFDINSDPNGIGASRNLQQYPEACGDDRNEYLIREHRDSIDKTEQMPNLDQDNIYVCADRISDCAFNGEVYGQGQVVDIQSHQREERGVNSVDEEICVDADSTIPGGEWYDVDNESINQFLKGEEGTYTPDDSSTYDGLVRDNASYDGDGVKWFTDEYSAAREVELSPFNLLNYSDGYALEDDVGPGVNYSSDEGPDLYHFTPDAVYSYFEEGHIEDDRLALVMDTGNREEIVEGEVFEGISVRMKVGWANGTALTHHGASNNQDEENVPPSVDFNITKWGHEIPLNDSTINRREDTWAIANRTDAVIGPTGKVYMDGKCYGQHVMNQPDLQVTKGEKVVGNSFALSTQVHKDGSNRKKGVWVNPDSTLKSATSGNLTCELNATDWGYGYDVEPESDVEFMYTRETDDIEDTPEDESGNPVATLYNWNTGVTYTLTNRTTTGSTTIHGETYSLWRVDGWQEGIDGPGEVVLKKGEHYPDDSELTGFDCASYEPAEDEIKICSKHKNRTFNASEGTVDLRVMKGAGNEPGDVRHQGFDRDDPHVIAGDIQFDVESDPTGFDQENLPQYPNACGDDGNEYLIREHNASQEYNDEDDPSLQRHNIYVCADRISDCAYNGSVYSEGEVIDIQANDPPGVDEEAGHNSVDEEVCVDVDDSVPGGEWMDVDNSSINQFIKGEEGTYTPDDPNTYSGHVRPNSTYDGEGVKWFTDDYSPAREVEISPFNPLNYSDGYALEDDCGPGVDCSDEGENIYDFTPKADYSYFEEGHIEDDRLDSVMATGDREQIIEGDLFHGISVRMWVGQAGGPASYEHGATNNQDQENVPDSVDFNITKWGNEIPLNDSTINRREDTWAIANRTDAVVGPTGQIYMNGSCYGTHVLSQPDLQVNKSQKVVGNSYAMSMQIPSDGSDYKKGVWVNPDSTIKSAEQGILTCELNSTDWGYGYDKSYEKGDEIPEEEWSFNGHSDIVNAVDVGPNGNIYSASVDGTVKKISPGGNEIWSFEGHTDSVEDIAVDSNGYVYTTARGSDYTTRKLTPEGDELWSFSEGSNAVAVDSNRNIYIGSFEDELVKISPEGNEIWRFTGHDDFINDIVVDSEDNIYSTGYDQTVRKISPGGNEIWSFEGHTDTVFGLAVNSKGEVYSASWDETLRKISSTGDEIWKFSESSVQQNDVEVGPSGNVYSVTLIDSDPMYKISADGEKIWSLDVNEDDGNGVAVDSNGNAYTGSSDETVRKVTTSREKIETENPELSIIRGGGNEYGDVRENGYDRDDPHVVAGDIQFDNLSDPGNYNQDNLQQYPNACGDDRNEYLIREHNSSAPEVYNDENNPSLQRDNIYVCADRISDCAYNGSVYSEGAVVDIQANDPPGVDEEAGHNSVDGEICVDMDESVPGGEWIDVDNSSMNQMLKGPEGTYDPDNPETYQANVRTNASYDGEGVKWFTDEYSAAREVEMTPFNPLNYSDGYALEDDCGPGVTCSDEGTGLYSFTPMADYSYFEDAEPEDDRLASLVEDGTEDEIIEGDIFEGVSVRMRVGQAGGPTSYEHGASNNQDEENVPPSVDFNITKWGHEIPLNDSTINRREDTWAIANRTDAVIGPTGKVYMNGSCYGTDVRDDASGWITKGEKVVGNSYAMTMDVSGDGTSRKKGVWVNPDSTVKSAVEGGFSCELNVTDWGYGYNTGDGDNLQEIKGAGDDFGEIRNDSYDPGTPHVVAGDIQFDNLSDPGNYNQDNLQQYPNACGDDRNEYLIREHQDSTGLTEQDPNLSQNDIYVCADRVSDCAFNGSVYSAGEVVDIQSAGREERGADSVDEEVCVDVDKSIPGGEWYDVDNESLNQYLKGEDGTYEPDNVDSYSGHVRANETYDGEGVKWFTDSYPPAREVEISPYNPLNYSDGYPLEDDVGPGVEYTSDEGPEEEYFTPDAVYSYFEEGHITDDRLDTTMATGDREQILDGDLFEGIVVRMRVGYANGTSYTAHGKSNNQDKQLVPDSVDFTDTKWGYTIGLNDSTIDPREDTWAIANRTDAVVGPTGQIYMNGSCYGRNALRANGYNVTKGEKVVGNSYAMSLDVDGDNSDRKRGVWVNPDSTNKSALSGVMSCDLNATDWGYGYNEGEGEDLAVVRGDARENGYEEPEGHVVVGHIAFDSEHDPVGQPQDNLKQFPDACGDDRNEYLIREHRAPEVQSEQNAQLERDNIYACADRITDCVYNGSVYSMGQTKDVSGTNEELGVNSGDAEVCVDTEKSIPGGEWHDPDNSSIQDIIVGSGTFERPGTYDGKPTFERRGGGVRWFNTSYGEDLEYPINESLTSPWSEVDYSAGFAFEDDCDERLAYCEDSGLLETHKEGVAVYGPFQEGRLADDGLDSEGDRLIDGYHIRMWVNGSAEHGAQNGQQFENVYSDLPQLNDSTIDPNEDTWAISSEPYYAVGPTGAVYENGSCHGQTNPETKAGTVVANSFVLAHDVDGDGVKEGDWVDPDNHEEAVLKGRESCSLGEFEDWGLGFKNESRDELKIVRGKEEARSLGYETDPEWQKQLVTGPITFDNESISGENPGSMDQDDLPQHGQACGDDQNETLVREHSSLTKDLESNKSDEQIPTLQRENIYVCADRPSDCAFNGSVYSEGQLADVSSDREAGDNSSDLEVCIDSDPRIPGGEWMDLDNSTWNQYLKGGEGTYTPDEPSTYEHLVGTNESRRNYWLTDDNPHANESEISPYNPINYSDGYALEDDCDPDLAYCADIGTGLQHNPTGFVYNSFEEDAGEDDANILTGKAARLYVGYANGTAWAHHGATNNQSEENAGDLNFTVPVPEWHSSQPDNSDTPIKLNDSTIQKREDTWAIANRSDSVVGPTGKLYDPGKCYGGIPDASEEEWITKNDTVMANSLAYSMEVTDGAERTSDNNKEGVWINPDSTNETLLTGGFSCELNTSDWGMGYDMGPDSNLTAVETSESNIRTPGYEPSDLHAVSGPIAFDIESDPGPKEQKDKPQYPSACGDDQGEFLIREHSTPDGNEYNESLQKRDNIYVCADRISDCAYNGGVYSEGQTVDISNASIPDEDPEKGDNINDPEICLDLDKSIPGGEWYDMDNNWTVKSRIEEVGYAPSRTWDNIVYFQNRYFGESPGTDWKNHTQKLNRTELDYFNGTGNYSSDYEYYAPKGYAREDDCGPLMRQASTGPCGDVGPGTQNTSWFNAGNNSYIPSNEDMQEGAPQDNYDDSLGFKGVHNKIDDDSDQLEPGAPTEANWNLTDVFGFGYRIYDSRDSTPGPDRWALTRYLNYSIDNRGRAYAPGTETRAGCFYRPNVEPRTDIDDETVLKTEKVFGNSFANATDYDGDTKVEGVWKNPDDMEAKYGNFSCDLTGPDKGYGIDTGPDDGEFRYKNDDKDTKVIIGDIAFATIEGKTGSFDQEPPVCGDDHKEYLIEELGATSNSLPNQGRFGCGTDYDDCVSRTGGEFALYRNGDYVNTEEASEEFGRVKQDREVCQQTTGDKYGVWYDQDYSEDFCRANNLYGQVGVRWFNQSYIDKHPYSVVEGINDDMNPYLYKKISDYNISLQGNATEYEDLADKSGYTPVPTGKDVNRSIDQYYENYDPSSQYLNYSATGGFCGGDEVRENIVVQDSSTELIRSNYSVVGVADSADDCVLDGANYEEISHEKRKLYDEGENVKLDFGVSQRNASCYGGTWYANWPISFIQDNVSVEEETSRDITFQVINIRDTETTYRVSLEAEDDIAPFTSFTRFNSTGFETSIPAESSRRYNVRVYGQSTDLGPEDITVRAAAITGDINGTDSVTVNVVEEVDSETRGQTSEVPGLGTLQLLMLALLAYITFYLRMGRIRQK
jgi:outer membrane protein assembly factor BamB